MRLLITGGSGFVGRALCLEAAQCSFVRAATRSRSQVHGAHETVLVGNIDGRTDWCSALKSIDTVIHLASRVHISAARSESALADFRKVNVAGTERLAQDAASAGVRRLIYLSSIKALGERTTIGSPLCEEDSPAPNDPYGISKWEAEQALLRVAQATGLEVVVIRPPLVYGPGVRANFQSLMRLISKGVPLPLAAVTENRRSLVYVGNLVSLALTCVEHPDASNQTFHVSDDEDVSTAELAVRIGLASGRPARLFHVPVRTLELAARLLGMQSVYQRLCGSLQVDISKSRRLLNWSPPVSVADGLQRTFGDIDV